MVEQREARIVNCDFSRISDGRGGPQSHVLHVNEH